MESERRVLWTVNDPPGLAVTLTEDVWQHHIAYRPELETHFQEVKGAVQDPDSIYFDPDSTANNKQGTVVYWYYKGNVLAGKYAGNWVAVVVKVLVTNEDRQGFVETALLPDRILKRLVLEWKK